ncbi:polyprenyl diphosphate synthase [Leucobacter soli]|uniref:Isoprenyl transferase n=1 Tax=Leucobacter soli TaxID=2812850 RepID=A0A916K155_9MICO|nr:polyprenyl diphosphate synthase [Leucobacter soli]CAG7613979.1 (2Z,6E)-farnesyl diphosphate synthase [Leucobacter soli]
MNPERTAPRPGLLYRLYQRRLRREIDPARVPHHIAIIVDGNRRWAKQRLQERVSVGHRAGARKVPEFLAWCEAAGVKVVTLYLLSTDNLSGRDDGELQDLFGIISGLAGELAEMPEWRVKHVGSVDGLSPELVDALARAEERTKDRAGLHINLAVGYGGRSEITAAMHSVIAEHQAAGGTIETLAERLTPETIGAHLWTRGQADPELVIRTSGEQRLSDFMIWQSAYSEFYVVEALYPDLREVDLLRALRDYSTRQRRLGR